MSKGLPVGISNFEIESLSKLNRYLQRALIEFPCADIKIFLSFMISIFFCKNLLLSHKCLLETLY